METTEARQAQQEGDAASRLRSYAVRIVSLEADKKEIADDIKSVYADAKAVGFDRAALRIVVSRLRETESEREARQETEALAQVYLASLGMLEGTPLGEAARRRFDPVADPGPDDQGEADDRDEADTPPPPRRRAKRADPDEASEPEDMEAAPPAGAMGEAEIAAARDAGGAAAQDGQRIFDNPFVAGDPRRAAWDEGWCAKAGSDGMDLPDAYKRPSKRKKPPEGDDADEGAAS